MNIKLLKLPTGPMRLTGSKVLELIQDNYTPPIDLLVRESIQNSADAILDNKDFGKINFRTGEFDKGIFSSSIELIDSNINNIYSKEKYKYLAIIDSNTCGLLGSPIETKDNTPKNLYSLVYDIMNKKEGNLMGGSHGIGKSVYYRYGAGICIYYSRTFENGKYINKLAGAIIQDETKNNCLLGDNTSGIGYLGDIVNGKQSPIYDDEIIREFLSIFNINMYTGLETGTTVIIPFVDENKILTNVNNDESDTYWSNNLEYSLEIAIQRWYFARINNEQYNGKYLKIAVNNKKVELNKFFQQLQNLYNNLVVDSQRIEITDKKLTGDILGTFIYKVFSKEELGMVPPYNLPSPKYMTDSSYDVDEKGLLFYLRKPGMVVNYENSKFGYYSVNEENYLIGMFILNDEAIFNDENLGKYIRKSEEANHKEWNDINVDDFPYLKGKKPFKKICTVISRILAEEFKQINVINLEGSNTFLQKKLGEKLMPPSDFGNRPGIKEQSNSETFTKSSSKPKAKIELIEIDNFGILTYLLEVNLKINEKFKVTLNVKVGGKSYSFDKWNEMNFPLPCKIKRIDIEELYLNSNKINLPHNVIIDEGFTKTKSRSINGLKIYKFKGVVVDNNCACGIQIQNVSGRKLKLKFRFKVEPLDNKYSIMFSTNFKEVIL